MAGMYPELHKIVSVDARPFNTRKGRYPELIFVPRNEEEIIDILREARKRKKHVAARCGGHSYASYGLGGSDGAWVIDVQQFDKVDIDPEGDFAYIGAGNRLGRVALQLYDRARKAIPHGLCPRVGVSGHALHGGYGFSSRNWGLALDSIQALHVILPDGRKVWASQRVQPDLFWALLGAGSSYGIVTEFKMRLKDAPERCIHYWYTWVDHAGEPVLLPAKETLKKVHHEIQEFVHKPAVPKELAVRMRILKNYMEVTGAFWGTYDDFLTAITPLTAAWEAAGVKPDEITIRTEGVSKDAKLGRSAVHERSWRDMLLFMANDDHLQNQERQSMSVLSAADYKLVYLENLLDDALASLDPPSGDITKDERLEQIKKSLQQDSTDADEITKGHVEEKVEFLSGLQSQPAPGKGYLNIRDDEFPELVNASLGSLTDEFFATSLCVENRIDAAAAERLWDYIDKAREDASTTDPNPKGYNWFLLIDVYGGTNSMIKNGANKALSCYSFRDHMFTLQFYINVNKEYAHPAERAPWDQAIKFLHDMRGTIKASSDPDFKVYMCYIDPEDKDPNAAGKPMPASFYYGHDQYNRLKQLKEIYDKDHILWNPQSIGAETIQTKK